MFPQFRKLNNESGIVLFVVLMTAFIIILFSLGILTQSMNETNYAQQQIDQIISDQLAKGIFWNAYSSGNWAPEPYINVMQGRNYEVTLTSTASMAGVNSYNVVASYDTFN